MWRAGSLMVPKPMLCIGLAPTGPLSFTVLYHLTCRLHGLQPFCVCSCVQHCMALPCSHCLSFWQRCCRLRNFSVHFCAGVPQGVPDWQ